MIQGCTPRGMLDGRENMQQRQEKKQKTEQVIMLHMSCTCNDKRRETESDINKTGQRGVETMGD